MSYNTTSPIPITAADISGANLGQRPDLINRADALFVTADGNEYRVWRNQIVASVVPLSESITLTSQDDGIAFAASAALTVTVPAGLVPKPAVVIVPPPSGNLSVAFTGGATGNGAGTTLTRSRSSNPAGILIQPYTDTNGYGVSGA